MEETGGDTRAGRFAGTPPALAIVILIVSIIAAVLRIVVIAHPYRILSSDEAVFGLMGLYIWKGIEYPVFCWEAHYAGALISYIAAPFIGYFGAIGPALTAATLPFGVGAVALGACWGHRASGIFGALLTGLLLAVPLPVFLIFSTMAHGGYPETFFFATAIFLLVRRADAENDSRGHASLLTLAAFLSGVGTYVLWLIVPFVTAAWGSLLFSQRRREHIRVLMRRGVLAFLVGFSPMIVYNIVHPLASFRRAAGRTVGATALRPEGNYLGELNQGLAELFAPWFGLPLLAIATACVVFFLARSRKDLGARMLLIFLPIWIIFAAVAGLDRSRHWTPLYWWLATSIAYVPLAGAMIAAATALVINLVHFPVPASDGVHQRDWVMDKLAEWDVSHVLTGYEWAYRITYYSFGAIIASPAAGPNTTERRPAFTREVLASSRYALLIPRSDAAPWLEAGGNNAESLDCFGGYCLIMPTESPKAALKKLGR